MSQISDNNHDRVSVKRTVGVLLINAATLIELVFALVLRDY